MPMPEPRKGEAKEDFLGRCMADGVMNSEHADRDERFAVCNSLWERKAMMQKGYTEGPLGLPMRPELATELEGLLKALDGDCKSFVAAEGGIARRAKMPAEMKLEPGERADVSVITTDTVDLDKEVLMPEGIDWTYFGRNGGGVTWAHKYDQPDVGRCLWMKRSLSPNGWMAKTTYHPRPGEDVLPKGQPWFPDVVNYYVQELGLKGKSIGFVPTEMRKPNVDEVKARPELAEARWVFPKSIGLEYAVAPKQANPDAVVLMVSKARTAGIETPEAMLKTFGIIVPGFGGDGLRAMPPMREEKIITIPELKAMVAEEMKAFDLGGLVTEVIERMRGRV